MTLVHVPLHREFIVFALKSFESKRHVRVSNKMMKKWEQLVFQIPPGTLHPLPGRGREVQVLGLQDE